MIDLQILFVATSKKDVRVVVGSLRKNGYIPQVYQANDPEALQSALKHPLQLVFVSPVSRQFPIEQTIAALRNLELDIPCIVLLKQPVQLTLKDVVQLGAHDCVAPDDSERMVPIIERELLSAIIRHNMREQVVTDHLLQEIDQYILRKYDFQNVVKRVCQRLVELFDFSLVWIGMKRSEGEVEITAFAGVSDYLDGLAVRWDGKKQDRGVIGTAIRENRPVVMNSDLPQFGTGRKRAEKFGMRSILAMPLGIKGDVIGTLTMYAKRKDTFDELTVSRLSAFASRVTVAMLSAEEQQELRLMEVAMNNAANAMFISDCNGNVQWLNEAHCRFSGYSAKELIGNNPKILGSGIHDAAFWSEMWQTIQSGKHWRGDIVNRNKSGDLYTVTQNISPIFNDLGEMTNFLAVQQDISEKRKLEEEIHYLAYHDTLTDLPNRILFQDRLLQEISHAKRGNTRFAVLYIDLDGFKAVNDTRGHAAGDKLLQIIAGRLRTCLREGDTVARLGGDEFTILLRSITQGDGLQRVLSKIIKSVSQPCDLGEFIVTVTASIGICLYPENATDVDEIQNHADEAMYQAKQAGKNRYVFFGQELESGSLLEWKH